MLRSLFLLTALAFVSGCDSQDSLLGEFVGSDQIGASSRAVAGEAVYTVVETAYGPEVVLGLFVGDLFESDREAYDYVLFRLPGERPGVGAVAIDDDPGYRTASATLARVDDADDVLDATGVILTGTDGTLAFTSVDSHGFVGGSYSFQAQGVSVWRAGRVAGSARGQFEARYVPPSTFRRIDLGL